MPAPLRISFFLGQLCVVIDELAAGDFAGDDKGDAVVEKLDRCLDGGAIIVVAGSFRPPTMATDLAPRRCSTGRR